MDHQAYSQRGLDGLKVVELDLFFFKIRGRQNPMHNATIIIGLFTCMMAGLVTVTSETFPSKKERAMRIIRLTGRAARRSKKELQDLWN